MRAKWHIRAGAYLRFLWHEAARSIYTPPGWDAYPSQGTVTPSIKFAGTHLYTWVERGTVRVKCLAEEHNTMSLRPGLEPDCSIRRGAH